MDVPTRQSYIMGRRESGRAIGSGRNNSVARTIGAAISPLFVGLMFARPALINLPFFIAGTLKIAYDLLLYKQFVAVRLRAQLPAELDAAFSRQHPVENQKRESLSRERRFGLFRAADTEHLVSTPFDEPLQALATPRVIFYEQNFHLKEKPHRTHPRLLTRRRRATPLKRNV